MCDLGNLTQTLSNCAKPLKQICLRFKFVLRVGIISFTETILLVFKQMPFAVLQEAFLILNFEVAH